MIKRTFDLVASLVGLAVLSPLMAAIAILVRRDSEGPALFQQQRVGRQGQLFTLLKFRTMTVPGTDRGPLITSAGDSRVTKVGQVLRSTKLDELPQLINVVKGDMSIVGPRPEVPEYVDLWPEDERQVILTVRPGITDPATVWLRHEEQILAEQSDPEQFYRETLLPQKARDYRAYVESRNNLGDFAIIARTLRAVIRS